MRFYKKTFSKAAKQDFAIKMSEIDDFCIENNISTSHNNDSYYFTLNGVQYRVSNHSIESSNAKAFIDGVQVRELYHDSKRDPNVVYIHASKLRIIEIYNDLKNGYELDGRGNRK